MEFKNSSRELLHILPLPLEFELLSLGEEWGRGVYEWSLIPLLIRITVKQRAVCLGLGPCYLQ